MKIDIRRYINLRDSLIQERTKLQARLQEINTALGESNLSSSATTPAAPTAPEARGKRRGSRGGLSLRDAVLQVIGQSRLTKEEVLDGVKKLGYRFTTKNPLNSLGVILYGKTPKFRNEGGRFSIGQGTAAALSNRASTPTAPRKKRKLSPEARERIAAAQRARWAKAKTK